MSHCAGLTVDTTRICPVCQYENLMSALYCVQCGALFSGKETGKVSKQWLEEILRRLSSQKFSPPPHSLVLQIVGRGEPILIEAKNRMVIGRYTGSGNIIPDINLTVFQGGMQGVSRQHAIVWYLDDAYFLEDLNSTNGTWVNEIRLEPHERHELHSGDLIRLGQMVFFLHFTVPEGTVK